MSELQFQNMLLMYINHELKFERFEILQYEINIPCNLRTVTHYSAIFQLIRNGIFHLKKSQFQTFCKTGASLLLPQYKLRTKALT